MQHSHLLLCQSFPILRESFEDRFNNKYVKSFLVNKVLAKIFVNMNQNSSSVKTHSRETNGKTLSDSKNPAIRVIPCIPKNRETLKWYGWGFHDSVVRVIDGDPKFSGNRYPICGKTLPWAIPYIKEVFDVDVPRNHDLRVIPEPEEYPTSRFSRETLDDIKSLGFEVSTVGLDRLRRARGQGTDELRILYEEIDFSKMRIPDAVAWPTSHKECVDLVNLANDRNFVIVPLGGGTCVSGALSCEVDEDRPILSVDTNQMSSILCVDRENMLVTAECGIIGNDLEAALEKLGYTTGHEPDSIELSTLGGWVATRASGIKQSRYGNIENMVVNMKIVTPSGVYEKGANLGRVSCGPDFNHLILGSEGIFGIITEVTIKIHPIPEYTVYDSIVFPDYYTGIRFLREVARRRWQPASIRLMDEEHVQIGRALRPEKTYFAQLLDDLKMKYLEKVKGFDLKKISAAIILLEGRREEVEMRARQLTTLGVEMDGVLGGSSVAEGGFSMSYIVNYFRDLSLDFNIVGDVSESTVPWSKIIGVDAKVKERLSQLYRSLGTENFTVMTRISQTYDEGCCYYLMFAGKVPPEKDFLEALNAVRRLLKDTLVAEGASISHHHGIGKQKKRWYEGFVSTPGANILRAVKKQLDPKNIFATKNFLDNFDIDVATSELTVKGINDAAEAHVIFPQLF